MRKFVLALSAAGLLVYEGGRLLTASVPAHSTAHSVRLDTEFIDRAPAVIQPNTVRPRAAQLTPERHPATEPVTVLRASPDKGPLKGKLRVEWVESAGVDANDDSRTGEIRVYNATSSTPIQVIPLTAMLPRSEMSFYFANLRGLGKQDLIFNVYEAGSVGWASGVEIYDWNPALNKFVTDEFLMNFGSFEPGSRPGCIIAYTACGVPQSQAAWFESEMCYQKASRKWKTVRKEKCDDEMAYSVARDTPEFR